MDEKLAQPPADRRISELAARQYGVVSRAQLFALGLGRGEIDARLRLGRLHPLHRGVYAVGHPRPRGLAVDLAAVLACGHGAVLSHRSAAALWCIRPSAGAGVDVTVSGRSGRAKRPGIRLHRARLASQDIRIRDGIPVTSPARTLVDLADVVSRRAVERAFDEAEYLRLDCTGLTPIAGRPGLGRLRDILAHHEAGSTRTRSELEERFLELCAGRGLPAPEVNARLNGHEVDFLWRGAGLVVELDGRAAHDTRRAFERDRMRDAELAVAGQRVVRVTPRRLETAPDELAEQILLLTRP